MYKKFEGLNLEDNNNHHPQNAILGVGKPPWQYPPLPQVEVHLADTLVENFHLKRQRPVLDFCVSVAGHSVVVALLILAPLVYTHALDLPKLQTTFLVGPPPPPPPAPPAVHLIQRRPKSFFSQGKLFAPKFIPKEIAQVKEQAAPTAPAIAGQTGGVPGGIPGGQIGGVLGGILGGRNTQFAPPPPKPVQHLGPYHLGGKVQPPRLIYEIDPVYPPLARQARVEGNVVIDSVIDQQGRVTEMKVVSGNILLVHAALQALEQWRYQPTLLNGKPVAVDMNVTVHFQLAS